MKMKPMSEILEERDPMIRIAEALEEILRLVKLDQAKTAERMKELDSEQTTRITNGPGLPGPCALARGSGTKLQAPSGKLQASSCKLDKIKL